MFAKVLVQAVPDPLLGAVHGHPDEATGDGIGDAGEIARGGAKRGSVLDLVSNISGCQWLTCLVADDSENASFVVGTIAEPALRSRASLPKLDVSVRRSTGRSDGTQAPLLPRTDRLNVTVRCYSRSDRVPRQIRRLHLTRQRRELGASL